MLSHFDTIQERDRETDSIAVLTGIKTGNAQRIARANGQLDMRCSWQTYDLPNYLP